MRFYLRKVVLFGVTSCVIFSAVFIFFYRSLYLYEIDKSTVLDNFVLEDKPVIKRRFSSSNKLSELKYLLPSLQLFSSYNVSWQDDLFDFTTKSSTHLTFSIPKCPELENFPQPRREAFQRVSDERHDIYIFSAYSDHRVDLEVL